MAVGPELLVHSRCRGAADGHRQQV